MTGLSSPAIGLIGSLGSAAAAVAVVWLFMQTIRTTTERRDAQFDRFVQQFDKLTRDNMDVMHEVGASLRRLEETIRQKK